MSKKAPPESLPPTTLAFMSELNECQRRHYLAQRALDLGKHGKLMQLGADMKVALVNDGPVTICIDTKNRE